MSEPLLQIDVFTLFPAMFVGPFSESILKRAAASEKVALHVHDIRDYATDKHRTADDTPYGGGAGMVMKAPPIVEAVESVLGSDLPEARVLLTSASGAKYSQGMAIELARARRIAIICGHYEGIDQRAADILGAEEISIGDYVLTGGEIPAMVLADSIIRLVPGVIDAASIVEESHNESDERLVEYPHFTRPASYRGREVPPVLLSGHHAQIRSWRLQQSRERTSRLRPDLIKRNPPPD